MALMFVLVLYCKRKKTEKKAPDSSEETDYNYPYQFCEAYGTRPTNPVFELVHNQEHVERVTRPPQTTIPMISRQLLNGHGNVGVQMTQNAAYM